MNTLTYRGKSYVQNKKLANKQLVELKYRRNIYTSRQETAYHEKEKSQLCYRGIFYQR